MYIHLKQQNWVLQDSLTELLYKPSQTHSHECSIGKGKESNHRDASFNRQQSGERLRPSVLSTINVGSIFLIFSIDIPLPMPKHQARRSLHVHLYLQNRGRFKFPEFSWIISITFVYGSKCKAKSRKIYVTYILHLSLYLTLREMSTKPTIHML